MKDIMPFNPYKILCWRDRIDEILEGKMPYPVALEIDPTNKCSSNCAWCMFKNFREEKGVSLPFRIVEGVLSELKGETKAVTFTGGGEPLVHPKINDMMRTAKELQYQVGLVTNGDLLNGHIDTINETCRYVRVSLDAGTKGTHQKLHSPFNEDSFDLIFETLPDINTELGIAFLIHPDNYKEIPLLCEKLQDTNVSYLQLRPCLGVDMKPEVADYVGDYLKDREFSFKVYLNLRRFDEVRFGRRFEKCRATPLLGIIGADANVYLCCQMRGNKGFSIGNLKKDSFEKVWNSSRHRKIIERINLDRCPPCRYANWNYLVEQVFLKDRMHRFFV